MAKTEVPTKTHPPDDISVNRLISVGVLTRFITDTGIQFFFPFLPIIAQGLNVSTIVMGRLVSLRSATGLLSPLFGELADRRGYRMTMRLGLLLGGVGYLLVATNVSMWITALGMFLSGVGTFAFVPTMQAYLSMKLPYHRRARGLGMMEYAWALSGIIGLYLVGLLIEATSWQSPLFIVSGGLFAAAALYGRLPATSIGPSTEAANKPSVSFHWRQVAQFFYLGENGRSAWAALASQGFILFSAMHLFINYGSWLERDYLLTASRLGQVALILGVADLSASILVSLFADRFGKRRSVLIGIIWGLVGFVALPFLNLSVTTAVFGLLFVRFGFEVSLISNMAVLSEQSPTQRGKVLTLGAACSLLGSTVAGFTGPLAFERLGVWGLGFIPAGVMLITLILMWQGVQE